MSTGHENVVWQSADGTWSRGFYAEDYWHHDGEDGSDPEVEYSQEEFDWVSTGLPSEQAAYDSWHGANPGHSNCIRYPKTDEEHAYWDEEIEHLDDIAAKLWTSEQRPYVCHGTPKRRVPRFLAREIAEATADAAYYRIEGYANLPTDVTAPTAELRTRLPKLTADERTAVSAELAKAVERIDKLLEPKPSTSWRSRTPPADAVQDAKVLRETLLSIDRDVTADAGSRPESATARAKTTPKSTAGSFAPKTHSAPDVTLGTAPGT